MCQFISGIDAAHIAPYVSNSFEERLRRMQLHMRQITPGSGAADMKPICVKFFVRERRGLHAAHICQFLIRERRGAYSSICVNFFVGERRGGYSSICVKFILTHMGHSSYYFDVKVQEPSHLSPGGLSLK